MIRSLSSRLRCSATLAIASLLIAGACTSRDGASPSRDTSTVLLPTPGPSADGALAETLAAVCPATARRGSVLIARLAPEDESGVTFKLLGDGAGPGVVLCRDVLYADVKALLALMGEPATVATSGGHAVIDSVPTRIQAYLHDSVLYVAVAPLARHRRALVMPSTEHPMDATIWPRATLLQLKSLGGSRGAAFEAAVREGLLPP